jgi:hypothetical protein
MLVPSRGTHSRHLAYRARQAPRSGRQGALLDDVTQAVRRALATRSPSRANWRRRR